MLFTKTRFFAAASALTGAQLITSRAAAQSITAAAQSATAAAASVETTVQAAVPYALKALGALVFLIVARMIAGWVGNSIRRVLDARRFDTTLTRFFSALARTLVLVAATLGVLGMFGVETTSFAAIIGAAGLAVGLAFQGTLGSFASGVLLLTFRPFKVGDYVETGGSSGTVDEIELFTTALMTVDNKKIIIPNSAVTSNTITNYSAMPTRRVDVAVGTAYAADVDATRAVLESVVAKLEKRLDTPDSQVFLAGLGASSIDWTLRVWAKSADYWDVHQQIVRDVKVALDEAGIGIPFPQLDVHLDKPS
jgi:small conductance mechanosensitive channel